MSETTTLADSGELLDELDSLAHKIHKMEKHVATLKADGASHIECAETGGVTIDFGRVVAVKFPVPVSMIIDAYERALEPLQFEFCVKKAQLLSLIVKLGTK